MEEINETLNQEIADNSENVEASSTYEEQLSDSQDFNNELESHEQSEPSELEQIRQEKNNLLEALRQEREERRRYKDEIESIRSTQQQHQFPTYKSPEEIEKERELSEAQKVLKGLGFMTKEDFEAQREQERQELQRQIELDRKKQEIERDADNLAREYDGQNGKPKFDKNKLGEYLEYGQKNNIFNLRQVFIAKHLPEIASSMANTRKVNSVPAQGVVSNSRGSQPDFDKMTYDQILEWQRKNISTN